MMLPVGYDHLDSSILLEQAKMDQGALRPQTVYGLASKSSSNLDDYTYDTRIGTSKVVNPKNNWKKNDFARISKKLDKVKSLSRRAVGGVSRAEAFRFEAVDRADAFKEVDYEAPEYYGPEDSDDSESDRLSSISEVPSDGGAPLKLKTSINENILMTLGILPEEIASLKSQIPAGSSQGTAAEGIQGVSTSIGSPEVSSGVSGGITSCGTGLVQSEGSRDSGAGIKIQISANGSEAQPGPLGGFGGSTSMQSPGMMSGPAVAGVMSAQTSAGGAGGSQVEVIENVPLQSSVEQKREADKTAEAVGDGGSSAALGGFGRAIVGAKGTPSSVKTDTVSGGSDVSGSITSKPGGAAGEMPLTMNIKGETPKGDYLKVLLSYIC